MESCRCCAREHLDVIFKHEHLILTEPTERMNLKMNRDVVSSLAGWQLLGTLASTNTRAHQASPHHTRPQPRGATRRRQPNGYLHRIYPTAHSKCHIRLVRYDLSTPHASALDRAMCDRPHYHMSRAPLYSYTFLKYVREPGGLGTA